MRRSNQAVINMIGPAVVCFVAVLVTTLLISIIDSVVPTEHLMLGYLLPIIFVAIYFGSTTAVLTSFASGLAAAYVLVPPKFSFYIDDPVHTAELGFTIVLAAIASKVVGALAGGAAAWPLRARAQQPAVPVVGFVHTASPGDARLEYGKRVLDHSLARGKAATSP